MLEVHGLTTGYGDTVVLSDLSFTVADGGTLSIIGPSGCGKSTLLLALAGLHPSRGSVELDGRPPQRPGLLLQNYGLFPWFTVRRNIEIALEIQAGRSGGHGLSGVRDRTDDALSQVGLLEKAGSFPRQLSGGQQQRVALARTLATQPELLLLDEPFSALDALTREDLQETLLGLLQRQRILTVLVTHSIEEAVYLGDSIGVMTGTPATLLCRDNPAPRDQLPADPGERRSAPAYLRACGIIRGWFRERVHA